MKYFLCLWIILTAMLIAQTKSISLQKRIYLAKDRVLPALVHVEPIKNIYTRGEKQRTLVTGSGVIFSSKGYVITNHHVAGNAEKVWCILSNKERITASVVGSDRSTDIAVLKLNLKELRNKDIFHAKLGNSDSLQVGQIVLALGSPLGLSRSVSMGVISSIDRYFANRGSMISPYNLWIQTDAAINPGNSGGPLIDLSGNVIAINARAVFLADNLGFAIPVNLVREVSGKIIQGNSVRRSWIGIDFQEIKNYREYLELTDLSGVLISHVEKKSPAKKAGLKVGDVLQKIGDIEINAEYTEDLPMVRKTISNLPIDKHIPFKIWRNFKNIVIDVNTLEEPVRDEPEFEADQWGIVLKRISWHIYRINMLSDFNGVYITSIKPGSPGDLSNIRSGDIIRKINYQTIKDGQDFQRIYHKLQKSSEPIFLEIIRSSHPYFSIIKQRLD